MLVVVEEFEAGAAGTLSVIFCVGMVVVVDPAGHLATREGRLKLICPSCRRTASCTHCGNGQ